MTQMSYDDYTPRDRATEKLGKIADTLEEISEKLDWPPDRLQDIEARIHDNATELREEIRRVDGMISSALRSLNHTVDALFAMTSIIVGLLCLILWRVW